MSEPPTSEPPAWEPPAWEPPAAPQRPSSEPGPDRPPASPLPANPGVIPLRPLGIGEILDGAFRTIRRHPRATLGLAALATAVELATSLAIAAASGRELISSVRVSTGLPSRAGLAATSLLSVPIGAAVGAVLTAMIAVIASDAVLGRRTGARAAWDRVRPLVWRLLVLGVVTTVGAYLGLILLLVPGIFLWGAWALAVPAMALERTGVGGALRRSWRLAVPDWWRVWWTRVLSVLLGALVSSILSLPAIVFGAVSLFRTGDGGDGEIGVGPAAALIVTSSAASTLVAPFLAAVLALVYIDRRMRAEGLDVTLARSLHA